MRYLIVATLSSLLVSACSFKPVTTSTDIVFSRENNLKLDVYSPKKIKDPKEVLVFIHGGNWERGDKSMYKFFGKGMARKGLVSVVIDYRLNPIAAYDGMAQDAARAIKWTKENITQYGGDSSKIFVTGHSAGGHLAALIATDNSYFESLQIKNPIKGAILNDAFGLDMFGYLSKYHYPKDSVYLQIFTKNPEQWKKASPIFYLKKESPKMLMYLGGKTYPGIIEFSKTYYEELKKYQPDAKLVTVKGRHHVAMIGQFYFSTNKRYKEILDFIKTTCAGN